MERHTGCGDEQQPCQRDLSLAGRRRFLFGAGATLVWLAAPGSDGGQVRAQRAEYPRRRVGSLSALTIDEPVSFRYPWDHPNSENYLLKLGEPAGGGVGPGGDVVAFNSLCTHQGASLKGAFDAAQGIAGPCSLHWTTFDLARHGMVVSGHATQGLPQILLEADGDDLFAIGVQGLIFGYYDNRRQPQ